VQSITKSELISDLAIEAFLLAEYRLRHNTRYRGWREEKRVAYCLKTLFDAIVERKGVNRDV
jgi:hypothetical protein